MTFFNKLWHLFVMLCYIYCSLAAAYAETMRSVKGIVHPKMKILHDLTHPQVVPNLYEFLCSAEHKGRYFEESL